MIVKELIEKLSSFPPDMEVRMEDVEYDAYGVVISDLEIRDDYDPRKKHYLQLNADGRA